MRSLCISPQLIALLLALTLSMIDVKTINARESSSELLLHVPSPDWQDQVIYFAFIDRFKDGDPSNNDMGYGEFDPTIEHSFSGGDLKGVINEIEYINGLGATALWLTPAVENQWISKLKGFTGYGGYYATNFTKIDPHFGSLQDYQQLSHELHSRSMYLIQDIVVNHTGFFFGFAGDYDKNGPSDEFILLEEDSFQSAPNQFPFNLINYNDPEHRKAAIYNWTPTIHNYKDLGDKQYTHQLGGLNDINTKNPLVLEVFKETYGDWIRKAGVDAFRIDTVRYVEPEFFQHFIHDADGIKATAKETGRNNFISFGEVLEYAPPLDNSAEKSLSRYVGQKETPILDSVISFPLKRSLKTVFAEGKPTAHLAYRIEQHMNIYSDPYITPTFIENHDVERFLVGGSRSGLKQSLAVIFTIPGIPVLYQGTEQELTETRQAMFAGGYESDKDHFNPDSYMYKYISSLAKLRTGDKILTRGTLEVLASDDFGPGLIAYKREYEGRSVVVLLNSAEHDLLVSNLDLGNPGTSDLKVLFKDKFSDVLKAENGVLTTVLPARSIVVAELEKAEKDTNDNFDRKPPFIEIEPNSGKNQTSFNLQGHSDRRKGSLLLVKNGNLNTAKSVLTDENGNWSLIYNAENLGKENFKLAIYDELTNQSSNVIKLSSHVKTPTFSKVFEDPSHDDKGLTGKYIHMLQPNASGQKDILEAEVKTGGSILQLTFTMRDLTSDWLPPNAFDNVAFSMFFDYPNTTGQTFLPKLNADMPDGSDWNLAHVAYGWGNMTYSNKNAQQDKSGEKFGISPKIEVDAEKKTISFVYNGENYGISSWKNVHLYVTTWDIAGEGAYTKISTVPAKWEFSGAAPDDPKILDWMTIEIK